MSNTELDTTCCDHDYESGCACCMGDCENIIECSKHEGAYDCTPFCRICEGKQFICKKQLDEELQNA